MSLGDSFQCVVYLSHTHSHSGCVHLSPRASPVVDSVSLSGYFLLLFKENSQHTLSHWQLQKKAIWSQYLGENAYTIMYTHTHHNKKATADLLYRHLYLRVWTWGNVSGRVRLVGRGVWRLLFALTGGQWKVLIRSMVAVTIWFYCCGHLQLATVIK